jgi:hypothetical protein
MHTILDSMAANSAIWILLCIALLATVQTEHVSQELKESYFASQASSIMQKAESLGYVDALARCEGDLQSADSLMLKIVQLCPRGMLCTIIWKTEKGDVIKAIGTQDLGVAGYVTTIVSTPTQITYLTLGVGER